MQDQILKSDTKIRESRKPPVFDILDSMKVSKKADAVLIPEGQFGTYKVAKSTIQKLTTKVFIIKNTDEGAIIWRTE